MERTTSPETVLGPLAQIELLHDRVNPSRYKKLKLILKLEKSINRRISHRTSNTTTELQSAEREDIALLKRYGNWITMYLSLTLEQLKYITR